MKPPPRMTLIPSLEPWTISMFPIWRKWLTTKTLSRQNKDWPKWKMCWKTPRPWKNSWKAFANATMDSWMYTNLKRIKNHCLWWKTFSCRSWTRVRVKYLSIKRPMNSKGKRGKTSRQKSPSLNKSWRSRKCKITRRIWEPCVLSLLLRLVSLVGIARRVGKLILR